MEFCWNAQTAVDTRDQEHQNPRVRQNNKSRITSENAVKKFCYLPNYRALICWEHKTVIQNLNTHLQKYHTASAEERRAIVCRYSGWWIKNPAEIELPLSIRRPKLDRLRNLRVLACPIVLLSATLPPVLEQELGESMLVRCAAYIRACTVRPNIRYLV